VVNAKRAVQVGLAALLSLDIVAYVAAKIHFFTRYDPHREGSYLREHRVYWATMAIIALLIWLVEKLFPGNRGEDRDRNV
jgi:hypothetical protein